MLNVVVFFAQIALGVFIGRFACKGLGFIRFRGNEYDQLLALIAITYVICLAAQSLLKLSIPALLIVSIVGGGIWQTSRPRLH